MALTDDVWEISNLHDFVPRQAPPHPKNRFPFFGLADRVTFVPSETVVEQFGGHSIPDCLLVTMPEPETETVI